MKRLRKLWAGTVVAVGVGVAHTGSAGANQVRLDPSCGGDCPGSALIQKLLNWGGQYGLWASLGAFIAGGAYYGWSYWRGQTQGATRGQQLALGGSVGAMAIGISATAINLFFKAANT